MQIISFTSASSSSSSSSSANSSRDHCHRAEIKGMNNSEHHSPPPHFKAKKHHRPHPRPGHHSPPRCQEDYHLSPPQYCSDHHHHEKGKLRVKPPKPSKKIRKLHHKLMKACKLPKGGHHGRPHKHVHLFPPEERFLCTRNGDPYSPGCCLHSVEEGRFSSDHFHEIGFHHHDRPRRHAHPHPPGPPRLCQRSACIKSEVLGGAEPLVSPSAGVEAPLAEPPISLLPAPAMPMADGIIDIEVDALTQKSHTLLTQTRL